MSALYASHLERQQGLEALRQAIERHPVSTKQIHRALAKVRDELVPKYGGAFCAAEEAAATRVLKEASEEEAALDEAAAALKEDRLREDPNGGTTGEGAVAPDLRLRRAVEWPLHHADAFSRLGISSPRGVLLHGPRR